MKKKKEYTLLWIGEENTGRNIQCKVRIGKTGRICCEIEEQGEILNVKEEQGKIYYVKEEQKGIYSSTGKRG
jgi:hypothetical protein